MDLSGKPLQKAFVRGRHVAKNLIIRPDSWRGPALRRMLSEQPPHGPHARILEPKKMLLQGWRGRQGPRGPARKLPLTNLREEKSRCPRSAEKRSGRDAGGGWRFRTRLCAPLGAGWERAAGVQPRQTPRRGSHHQ